MKRVCSLFFIVLSFLFSSQVYAKAILQDVQTRFEGSTFVTDLIFNTDIQAKDILVEYINQTIQFNIPGARVKNGKLLKKINQENVKSIYTYQFNKNLMRTRIIHNNIDDIKEYEGFVKINSDKNVVSIFVYDPVVAQTSEKVSTPAIVSVPPLDLEAEMKKQDEKIEARDVVLKEMSLPEVLPERKNEQKKVDNKSAKTVIVKDTVDINKLKESEIPVFTSKAKAKTSVDKSLTRMLMSIGVILLLAVGLVIFGRWWSKNHKTNTETTKIKVLTQHHLGPKKSLAIIRVAGESILLGVTDHNISMIKTLSFIDDEINDTVPENFNHTLKGIDVQENEEKYEKKITYNPTKNEMHGLTSRVADKLKQMRSL